jgi:type I restriction enzyme, S subunit
VVHVSATALAGVTVLLPAVDEQLAIAQVLSDIDADLFAIEARLAKARDLKQAMMQLLLTGRIRLVEAQTA